MTTEEIRMLSPRIERLNELRKKYPNMPRIGAYDPLH